jgi:hypothetical protein
MLKNSKAPFERVSSKTQDDGAKALAPYYATESESESDPSSSDEDTVTTRWCTVRKNSNVPLFGDSSLCIGLSFTRNIKAKDGNDSFSEGTIAAVMKNKSFQGGALHFKLVNSCDDSCYVLCKVILSTKKTNVYKVIFILCL